MARFKEKIEARRLRLGGESIRVVAKKLNVSPASVSEWCRDIKLSDEQIRALEERTRDPFYGKRQVYLEKVKKIKNKKILELFNQGKEEIGKLTRRELFLTGTALYWAEGFKKDSQAGFANSDYKMIRIFLEWLKVCFSYDIDDLSFRVTVNVSHKNRIGDIQKKWAELLAIPEGIFQKPFFQNVVLKKVYENSDDYLGVLRVKVRKSTDFLRKIHGFIEGLSQTS